MPKKVNNGFGNNKTVTNRLTKKKEVSKMTCSAHFLETIKL